MGGPWVRDGVVIPKKGKMVKNLEKKSKNNQKKIKKQSEKKQTIIRTKIKK